MQKNQYHQQNAATAQFEINNYAAKSSEINSTQKVEKSNEIILKFFLCAF
jgi:hypothetical protein